VDANVGGNSARWINHSCAPNCRAYIEEVDGAKKDKVIIETRRAIKAGEELTYTLG
jgi:SET domain-containing protein